MRELKPPRGPRAAIVVMVVALALPAGAGQGAPRRTKGAAVTGVTDGDTITAELAQRSLDVRLIGVDTPETVHPSVPDECFGKQASTFTTKRLLDERVRLEFDRERLDRYGRTLAYVWVKDRLFNVALVRRGFATVSIYPPNDRYEGRLQRAQDLAERRKRGLWGACETGDEEVAGGSEGGEQPRCDPAYPDFCIAPPPPDQDCADVPRSDFRVVGADPHGFDGDDDGVGCES